MLKKNCRRARGSRYYTPSFKTKEWISALKYLAGGIFLLSCPFYNQLCDIVTPESSVVTGRIIVRLRTIPLIRVLEKLIAA
jgi:hypothetical protein